MGAMVSSRYKLPDEISEVGPFIRTPLTDIAAPLIHWDMGPCVGFEARYLNCVEAHGNLKGVKECKFLYQDFAECAYQMKQKFRVQAMMTERWKQYVRGKIGLGPEVPFYAEPPPMDCYPPDSLDLD